MNDESKIIEIAAEEAFKQLLAPFYVDAIRPAAREIGNGLASIMRMVNKAIFLSEDAVEAINLVIRLSAEQLLLLPPDKIIKPDPRIAIPLLEDSRLTVNEPELRIMFANLLSASMNIECESKVHPCFVEIIRNISTDEAKIIGCMAALGRAPMIEFVRSTSGDWGAVEEHHDELSTLPFDAGCHYPKRFPLYVHNIKRLGLLISSNGTQFCKPGDYDALESMPILDEIRAVNPHLTKEKFNKKMFVLTRLGIAFCNTVVGKETGHNNL